MLNVPENGPKNNVSRRDLQSWALRYANNPELFPDVYGDDVADPAAENDSFLYGPNSLEFAPDAPDWNAERLKADAYARADESRRAASIMLKALPFVGGVATVASAAMLLGVLAPPVAFAGLAATVIGGLATLQARWSSNQARMFGERIEKWTSFLADQPDPTKYEPPPPPPLPPPPPPPNPKRKIRVSEEDWRFLTQHGGPERWIAERVNEAKHPPVAKAPPPAPPTPPPTHAAPLSKAAAEIKPVASTTPATAPSRPADAAPKPQTPPAPPVGPGQKKAKTGAAPAAAAAATAAAEPAKSGPPLPTPPIQLRPAPGSGGRHGQDNGWLWQGALIAGMKNGVVTPAQASDASGKATVVELPSQASQAPAVTEIVAGSTAPLPNCTYIVLGATGDLVQKHAGRDALIHLAGHDILKPEHNPILLFASQKMPFKRYCAEFRAGASDSSPMSDEEFAKWTTLVSDSQDDQGNLRTASIGDVNDFKAMNEKLAGGNAVIYAAVPARLTMSFLKKCKESGLADVKDGSFRRVVLEKPFGRNAKEAEELSAYIQQNFQRGQVLLVDHFMGKPGLLNWVAAKTDPDIEAALSNKYVDTMNVVLDEKVMSNDRPYYRETGEMGDMANHALSLFATLASTLPPSERLDGHAIRDGRAEILDHADVDLGTVERGQFKEFNDPKAGAPVNADGAVTPSTAESYASFKLDVDTPRWRGVPVNIRLAKGVSEKRTAIDVHLKCLPEGLAQRMGLEANTAATMSFEISPQTKVSIKPANSDKVYVIPPDRRLLNLPPYARLEMDAMRGNNALYIDKKESISVWHRIMDPVEELWARQPTAAMFTYPVGAKAWELANASPVPCTSAEAVGVHQSVIQALAALYPRPTGSLLPTTKPDVPYTWNIQEEVDFRAPRNAYYKHQELTAAGATSIPSREELEKTERERLTKRLTDIANGTPVQRAALGTGSQNVGVRGVGVMGDGFNRNLARHGISTVCFDEWKPTQDKVRGEYDALPHLDMLVAGSDEEFVKSLQTPRRIFLLGRDGPSVDDAINKLTPYLSSGDIIVDMANSDVHDSERRIAQCKEKGFDFVTMGISGGERGAANGPGMMVGGTDRSYNIVAPYLEAVAPPNEEDGDVSVAHVGQGVAGQYVKMVHNGIEYAELQLLAETVDLFKRAGLPNGKIADIFDQWSKTEANSFLLKTGATVLRKVDLKTGQNMVDMIRDKTAQKGTGKRTQMESLRFGAVTPTISASVEQRSVSYYAAQREALSHQLVGPQATPLSAEDEATLVGHALNNYQAGKILSFVQGFHLMKLANEQYHMDGSKPRPTAEKLDIDPLKVARGWRNGTIVEGDLISKIARSIGQSGNLDNLLFAPDMQEDLARMQDSMRFVSAYAARNGVPTPGSDSCRNYYDSYRSGQLPGNFIAAERDFFGAHQYWRKDEASDAATFHQPTWLDDGQAEKRFEAGVAVSAAASNPTAAPEKV